MKREEHNLARTIKELTYIRVNNPTLNRNTGKHNLLHMWDQVLFIIIELKFKNQQEPEVYNTIQVSSTMGSIVQ